MLIFLTFLGLLISFVVHILLLFKVNLPSSSLSIVLNTCLVILFFTRLFLTRNLRLGNNWFLDSSIKSICPYKLKVCTIIIISYGFIMAVINLIGMFSKMSASMTEADYIIALRKLFIAVFSLLLSCYMFEFMLNLCFRILKKDHEQTSFDRNR
jgi:hypothetical protein